MNLPRVFIIILSWNKRDDTIECLASLAQSDYCKTEIVLVDNASTDGTVDAVRSSFSFVHVIENERNLGFVEGNNVGIKHALENEADYVLLLNDDTVVTPEMVSQLVKGAASDSTIGILCPTIQSVFDHSKQYVGASIDRKKAEGLELERSPEGFPEVMDTEYAPGCALLIKSEVVGRIGLLDSSYFAYFEDVDWSLRCRKAGYRVAVASRAKVFHKGSLDQYKNKSSFAMFYYRRNQFLFMRRHMRWSDRPGFLKHNARQCLLQLRGTLQANDSDQAEAIIDGWYAGITGRFGAERVQAPAWFKRLIRKRVESFIQLTAPLTALRRRLPLKTAIRRGSAYLFK